MKLKVGDKLFRLPCGNNVRRGQQPILQEVVVTKVGRKYFSVGLDSPDCRYRMESRHSLDGWGHKNGGYSATYRLYKSREDREEEILKSKLYQVVREEFQPWYNNRITLDQLREVAKVLKIEVVA